MISFENIVTYLGAAGIIYCLIKAFTDDTVDDINIGIMIAIIMVVIIFLTNKNKLTEGFGTTDAPVQDGLFESADGTVTGVFRPKVDNVTGVSRPNVDNPLAGDVVTSVTKTGVNVPVNIAPAEIANTTEPQITFEERAVVEKIRPVEQQRRQFDYRTNDQDMIDFMNLSKLDKEKYEKMMFIEDAAKEGIKERYTNEMVYTTSNPFNTLPLGRDLNPYTYLPEFAWYRGYEQPPVCIPSPNDCPVCPLAPSGTTDLMHFDNVDNIRERAPQGINLKYTKRVLNGDRS